MICWTAERHRRFSGDVPMPMIPGLTPSNDDGRGSP
jgi:hypothetical protein